MIQIYKKGNIDYSMNGDMVLFPTTCEVDAKLNGIWKMELVHPRDAEGRWREIKEERVISAPTFMGKRQLFRIREVEKTDDEVTATALPVFLDAEDDCFLMDVRPVAKNGRQALDMMMKGTKYSGRSDITTAATAYFELRNLISAISGEEEPTFIGRWGGEILYDNYEIIINERVGGDYGVEARYGKNMSGIDHTLDMSGVVTRIIPAAYNGYMMSGNEPWVDSERIGTYEKIYIRRIKFDDVKMREDAQEEDEENGVIICGSEEELDRALTRRCKELFAGGADLPLVSINIDMVELSGTEEYKEFKILETVGLGDDIMCRHKELDITTKERVIELVWDCCRDCIKNVVLGEALYDYFDHTSGDLESILNRVSGAIGGDGSVMAGAIKGFIDAAKTQLRLQNTVAKRQDVRAILFEDLDPASELFGAMALGTQGLQIAKRRTEDGRDWDWTTALTANGLIANIIVAGKVSSKNGKVYFDLDNNEIACSRIIDRSNEDITIDGVSYANVAAEMQKVDFGNEKTYGMLIKKEGFEDYGILISPSASKRDRSTISCGEGLDLRGGPGRYGEPRIGIGKGSNGGLIVAETEKNSVLRIGSNSILLQKGTDGYWQLSSKGHKFSGNVELNDSLRVYGTKNRVVKTDNYGDRLLYSYETAKPYFGDVGEGILDENGMCYIFVDSVFLETINIECQYQVFLQKYGREDIWVEERRKNCFIVKGSPGVKFGWEIKARQLKYEVERLEKNVKNPETDTTDYAEQAQKYVDGFFRQIL